MASQSEHRLSEVFGISRAVPENYVPRPSVDGKLIESLTRDKHIVIHGSSKQGKTCVRKYNLDDEDYIAVTCSNTWQLPQLHVAILKQAGFTIEQATTRTAGGQNKIAATISGELNLGIAKVGTSISGDDEKSDTVTTQTVSLELDPADVNEVIAALNGIGFARYIVLEDFHYLPEETQKDFSVALKAFHEGSDHCFVLVGVWLDKNRLIQYNGDLAGRVISINADEWSGTELRDVVSLGARLLNISFDPLFVDELVSHCFESVGIVQECCYRACERHGVLSTHRDGCIVGEGVSAQGIIGDVIEEQGGRYESFLMNCAEGFKRTELEMYRYILLAVLQAELEELESGMRYRDIYEGVCSEHPNGKQLNAGNLTQALSAIAALQVKKNIKPIILDYDQTNRRLNVVDKGFLIWLSQQDMGALRDLVFGERRDQGALPL